MGVPGRLIPVSPAAPAARCDRCGNQHSLAIITILVEETTSLPGLAFTLTLCSDCLLTALAVANESSSLIAQLVRGMRARPPIS